MKGDVVYPSTERTWGRFEVKALPIDTIKKMSQVRITIHEKVDTESQNFQNSMINKFEQLSKHIQTLGQFPLLHPVEHMKINNPDLTTLLSYLHTLFYIVIHIVIY